MHRSGGTRATDDSRLACRPQGCCTLPTSCPVSLPAAQSDFKAGKQYRRLMKQLNGVEVQRPMQLFRKNAMILVVTLLAVHLLFYVIFTTSITNLHK
jgi:hypothetical protein